MRTIVITGGNSGLGLETARILAQDPNNRLILGCRDKKKAEIALSKLRQVSNNANLEAFELDLASFASIHSFAGKVLETARSIEVLACNAGVQIRKGTQVTAEGFERTFGVNHLGHFLLTKLLIPYMQTTEGRIVLVSSATHFRPATLRNKLFGIPPAEYPGWRELFHAESMKHYAPRSQGYARYATSKLCAILFGYELNRKLREKNSSITVNLFDPGFMPGTNLARESGFCPWFAYRHILPVLGGFSNNYSLKSAAESFARLLTDPVYQGVTGQYFEKLTPKNSSKESYYPWDWQNLWSGSEKLIKEKFYV